MRIAVDLQGMRSAHAALLSAAHECDERASRCSGIDLPAHAPPGAAAGIRSAAQSCRSAGRVLRAQAEQLRRRIRLVELAESFAGVDDRSLALLLMVAVGGDKAMEKVASTGLFKAGNMSITALGYIVAGNQKILEVAAASEFLKSGTRDVQFAMQGAHVNLEWAGKLSKFGKGLSIAGAAFTFVGSWADSSSSSYVGKGVTAGFTTAGTWHPGFAALDLATGSADGKGTGVVGGAGDFYGALADGAWNGNLTAIEEWNRKNLSGEHGYVFQQYGKLGDEYLPAAQTAAVDATSGFLNKHMGENWPFDGDGRPW